MHNDMTARVVDWEPSTLAARSNRTLLPTSPRAPSSAFQDRAFAVLPSFSAFPPSRESGRKSSFKLQTPLRTNDSGAPSEVAVEPYPPSPKLRCSSYLCGSSIIPPVEFQAPGWLTGILSRVIRFDTIQPTRLVLPSSTHMHTSSVHPPIHRACLSMFGTSSAQIQTPWIER
ncbi:hypothetical protein BV22DRAFT_747820 [Leucogyrophana mollusca]|uniref:Uncharacterized protein n=1 Tax=Leucogyrophana mollusca TaxID=85980 RepID=A0ACB8B705_9AGAM|nr:hypothetical protein BV22DRAFT_747820 [Leucogyrophana mollusca]